ncbi:hypothetical protein AWZ03_010086 [Drosophila navojoa]|uniref:Uncharacterized protein n=1 Tax=Drosophila navojoa TaxID=7232 RepID=A0A484B3U9_DRONA|nr:hypothetical protein AWZ03_010086 [Drosophila navojoa]
MLPLKRRSMSGDILDSNYTKYGDSPSNVAHIRPIQEAGDMLTAETEPKRLRSVSVGTSTLFDSASGRFSESSACLCPRCLLQRSGTMMRHQKSVTVLWQRRWLATSSTSLWPRSVEATTDLRARHHREIMSRQTFLLHGLFILLKERRHRRYPNDLANRSQSELCLVRSNSRAQPLRSIRSLTTTMGSGSAGTESRAQIEQTESQSEIIADDGAAAPLAGNAAHPLTAVVPPMRQFPNEEQPGQDPPEAPQGAGSVDGSFCLLGIRSETPRLPLARSKSADELLHCRRGLRLKLALNLISCRSFLRH